MKIALFLLAAMSLQAPARAQVAYEQSYTGHLEYHNQVEFLTIPIDAGQGNLRKWTDSDSGGVGFDPVLTLWQNGAKLALNDDNVAFNFYQSRFDAGIELFGLADGTYVATITAFPNLPLGNTIGAGFTYDSQTPVPMATWCPPGKPGPVCQKDRHFSLHWTVQ